jgi:hypothetical protein
MFNSQSSWRGVAMLVLPLVVVGVTACGGQSGDGVATAGGDTTSPSSAGPAPATDRAERQRQYTECLRQHGVEVADAEQGKGVEVSQANDPAVKEAAKACQRYAPDSDVAKAGADVATLREYASCMRDNGIAEFPDPDPNGTLTIPKSIRNAPNYQEADRVCTANTDKPGK